MAPLSARLYRRIWPFAATAAALLFATPAFAATTPNDVDRNNISLPLADPSNNGCAASYSPGRDEVIFTLPYTYPEILSIIGNYTNLTWSGSPDNSVKTNNTEGLRTNDWTPGTARFYELAGLHAVETITQYERPDNDVGPYIEVHTLAPITATVPDEAAAGQVSAYSTFDGQVWRSVCDGKAVEANFTTVFCASNPDLAGQLFHQLHLTDARMVGVFLGGREFESCEALGGGDHASESGAMARRSSLLNNVGVATGLLAAVFITFL